MPHWYTFNVKMIPIYILGGLKSIPPSSCTSVYTFIMEVTPFPPWLPTPTQSSGVAGIPGIIYLAPLPLHWKIGNGPGSTKVPVLILSYCQVHIFQCRAPLPGGKVHTQDSSYSRSLWTPQTNLDVIGLRSVAFVPVSMYLKWYTFIKTVNAKIVASLDVTR